MPGGQSVATPFFNSMDKPQVEASVKFRGAIYLMGVVRLGRVDGERGSYGAPPFGQCLGCLHFVHTVVDRVHEADADLTSGGVGHGVGDGCAHVVTCGSRL